MLLMGHYLYSLFFFIILDQLVPLSRIITEKHVFNAEIKYEVWAYMQRAFNLCNIKNDKRTSFTKLK